MPSIILQKHIKKTKTQLSSKWAFKVPDIYLMKGNCVLFPYDCFLHRCTLQDREDKLMKRNKS